MYTVKQFYTDYARSLGLKLVAACPGLSNIIHVPDAQLAGLGLAGFLKRSAKDCLVILGRDEMTYLDSLPHEIKRKQLQKFFSHPFPAIFVSERSRVSDELQAICEERKIPLFLTHVRTMHLLSRLIQILEDVFAPCMTCHGCLIDVFGTGVLIQGASSIGKSDALLGLIAEGHRLVADDIVSVKKKEKHLLEGSGVELSRHHMEVRGIGIINVKTLYGHHSFREKMMLDLVIEFLAWSEDHAGDPAGVEENMINMLGVRLPYHLLPVWPGRNTVLLIKTLVLNYRLKKKGYHSARRFRAKLHSFLAQKNKESCVSYAE